MPNMFRGDIHLQNQMQTQIVDYEQKSQKTSKIVFLQSDYFTTCLTIFFFFLRYLFISLNVSRDVLTTLK